MIKSVIAAVKEVAAREIMPRYLSVAHSRKADGSLLTEADLATQTVLKEMLRGIRDCPVIGEEMTREEQAESWLAGSEGLWCIDPIDGTSNFVNGVPYFAVSVALMEGGRSVLGVVYDPVAGEAFYAERGKGAYLNDERLPIKTNAPLLYQAMASVDFKRLPPQLACELAGTPPYASARNFGACALEWCYTAAGRFDLYLHGGMKLWDYAAGALILEEAGGCMATLRNADFWSDGLWQRSVVAALDAALFGQWQGWIRAHHSE
ncbi:MAG: inositol monophosphatase family protein [Pseudomonadota bacterium]